MVLIVTHFTLDSGSSRNPSRFEKKFVLRYINGERIEDEANLVPEYEVNSILLFHMLSSVHHLQHAKFRK